MGFGVFASIPWPGAHSVTTGSGLSTMFMPGLACRNTRIADTNTWRHGRFYGLGTLGGNRSLNPVLTGDHWRAVRVTQHELAHNYGAHHSGEQDIRENADACTGICVMSDFGYFRTEQPIRNVWCTRCHTTIAQFRNRH